LVPEKRRLAAEEGMLSKKTWMQKKEEGWFLSCPLGLNIRQRVLLDGKNNLYELCVCLYALLYNENVERILCSCNEEDYHNLGYSSDGISVNVHFYFLVSSCIGPRL